MNNIAPFSFSLLAKFKQAWREVDQQWDDTRVRWVKNCFNSFEKHWPRFWQWFKATHLQKKLYNFPNLLSFSRMAAIWPIYKYLSLQNTQGYLMASIFFIFIILTDLFDGPIAKVGNCTTIWGIGLDPVADRLLVLSLIIIQSYYQLLLWPVLIWTVVGGEAFFCLLRFISFLLKVAPLTSNYVGKAKFFFQVIVVISLLLKIPTAYQLWVSLILLISLVLLCCNIILEIKLIFKTVFSLKLKGSWLQPQQKNLPNFLSLSRICLTPVLYLLIIFNEELGRYWAFYLFLLMVMTDPIDGYLARKFNCETKFGAMIDPWADKVVFTAIIVILFFYPPIPFLLKIFTALVVLAFLAEIINSCQRILKKKRGLSLKANNFGKWKCALQMAVIGILLCPYQVLSFVQYAINPLLLASNFLVTCNIIGSMCLLINAKKT